MIVDEWMMVVLVAIAGLVFGSFVTLASYRIPIGRSVVHPGSRCPSCSHALNFFDLWPVISWVISGGKCRHCKVAVHWRYPMIEVVQSLLFLVVYYSAGMTLNGVVLAMLTVLLLIMTVVDFEHYIIPDSIQIALILLAIAYQFTVLGVLVDLWHPFANAAFLFFMGWGLQRGFKWVRGKDGLGFGDVKFLGVVGLWLPFAAVPSFLFVAGVYGVVTAVAWRILGRGERFPFGPALGASLLTMLLFPHLSSLFLERLSLLYLG